MSACAALRVLFRAAAGPRRGFGHLVRCRSLARALGVRPLVTLRGGEMAEDTALGLGCDVVRGHASQLISALAPDVVVVDDPAAADAKRWIDAAHRQGCLVASVHDLGLGCRDADLVIDGSIVSTATANHGQTLAGPQYAVLDPSLSNTASAGVEGTHHLRRVLIALGGGPHVDLGRDIARAIVAALPDADVRIAGGFSAPISLHEHERITWTGPLMGLASELSRTGVAVVGGGVSLYEACALGVAAVGVPVVAAQRPTIEGFRRLDAARGVGAEPVTAERVAREALALLQDDTLRRRIAIQARRLVDGRGALRAAAAIERLLRRAPSEAC